MFEIYTLFKFLHVAAVIVWVGGVATLSLITARLAREQDQAALLALLRQASFYGRAIIGPAAALTLIAGFVMVFVARLGGPLWVTWGLVGLFVSLLLGAIPIRRTTAELSKLAATAALDDPRMIVLRRRLTTLNTINLLLLLSVVWAMVSKPSL